MYSGMTLAKSAAIAATFTSSWMIVPQHAAAHLTDRTLVARGMQSGEVRTIQSILAADGAYSTARPTGYFGTRTEKALRLFQKDHRLTVDGVAGPETKKALRSYVYKHLPLLSRGSKGNEVAYLQTMLNAAGGSHLSVDGYFGRKTDAAVRMLQQRTHIRTDGIAGPETWRRIEQRLAAAPKQSPSTSQKAAVTEKAQAEAGVRRSPQIRQPSSGKRVIRKQATAATVKEFYANSTAYTAQCSGGSGTTATGINLIKNPQAKVVAVDPSVIPLGTRLYVEGYGQAIAGDTGGAIKGRKIDVFFNSNAKALQWGRRTVKVKILN